MSDGTAVARFERTHAAVAGRLPGGATWQRRRARALAALAARGLPDRRDENWKYLDHARLAEFAPEPLPAAHVDAAELEPRLVPLAAARIVLVDGRPDRALSDALPPGIELDDVGRVLEEEPARADSLLRAPGLDPDDRYALLADAFTSAGAVLRAAPDAAPPLPLYVVHVATAREAATHHARLVIELGAGARLSIVEHFVALGSAPTLGNLAAELSLAGGAALEHVRLHEHGPEAAHVETWVARLADSSRYAQHALALGGRLLRSGLTLTLDGPASSCRLAGLLFADGARQVDVLTRVVHAGERTETSQEYRGVASGRGRASFNGRIVVEPGARGSNASQSSRNLLLSPLAEINARPQLEIHVDEVQCRHGATTGTHDPAQLFYLRSRGLDPAAAQAILTWAFCRDILASVPVDAVRAVAEARVAGMLPDRELIRGLA